MFSKIIVEIHAAEGGEDARMFVRDLFSVYTKYAARKNLRIEILDDRPGLLVFEAQGDDAVEAFKHEPGGHRVQRVPNNEKKGRVHSSSVTVAVLKSQEKSIFRLLDKDLEIKVSRSGGPGGQSVNTTDSAVQIKHLPTGIQVRCTSEKSQKNNKEQAFKILHAKLLDRETVAKNAELSATKKAQLGSGERSDKIRTVAFQRGEVADHVRGTKLRIKEYLEGKLELLDK